MTPSSGTYREHLENHGISVRTDPVLPFFHYDRNGKLVIRVSGYSDLDLFEVYARYGAVQLNLPDLATQRVHQRWAINGAAAKAAHYPEAVQSAYATKANDWYPVVSRVVRAGCHQETSSPSGVAAAQILWERGEISPEQMVICNGYITAPYAGAIHDLRHAGFANTIPVIDKESVLALFRRDHTWRFGIRQRAHLPAQTDTKPHKGVSRFGMDYEELKRVAMMIQRNPGWELVLYHFHLGSQIIDEDNFLGGLLSAATNYCRLRQQVPTLQYLDIGGGAPVQYGLTPLTINLELLLTRFLVSLKDLCTHFDVPCPTVITEWGRFTVAPSELRMMEIRAQYEPGFIQVHDTIMGSLADNWAIKQPFPVLSLAGLDHPTTRGKIVGLTCDEDDCLFTEDDNHVTIARPDRFRTPGSEVLVVANTGAYQSNLGNLEHCMQLQEAVIAAYLHRGQWVFETVRPRQMAKDMLKLFGWPV
ncbi:hypothetical protein HGA91_00270 [candidate division WWE3 bacterium]|nr:hypothetical protein [candidate division WWE3 bacterium]